MELLLLKWCLKLQLLIILLLLWGVETIFGWLHPQVPSPWGRSHIHGASFGVIIDRFSTLASPYSMNFVSDFKWFVWKGICSMDNIMVFKDHFGFKYVHDSRFSWQYKERNYMFKVSVDFVGSGANMCRCI